MDKKKFFIATTIPASLNFFKGNLAFLNQHFDVTAISSNQEFLREIGKREGVRTLHIPMVRPISLLKDIYCLFCFIFTFIKERPFIVHGNTPKASFLSMISAWVTHVPKRIYMCHGLRYQGETNKYKRIVLVTMEKLACVCATKVICVSFGVRKTLIEEHICSSDKAIVVHHGSASGIDINHFDRNNADIKTTINQELGIKENDFTFVFVGRVVQDKGVNELVNSFCKLEKIHPHTHLIIVGPTNAETNKISKETDTLINETKHIHLVGSQKDVRPYLINANALILPTYREGLPTVLIEAGAMSLAVITTNVIGCNEIIVPEKNGDLVEAKNIDSLFKMMKKYVECPEYVKDISQNARKMVIERYSQKIVWDNMLATYQKICNEV